MSTTPSNKTYPGASRMRILSAILLASLAPIITLTGCSKSDQKGTDNPQKSPSTYVESIIWPQASSIDKQAVSKMNTDSALAIKASRIPVLLVNDEKFLAEGKMTLTDYAYDFGVETMIDGLMVSISGVGVSGKYDNLPAKTPDESSIADRNPVRGKYGVRIYRAEDDIKATWVENGDISYELRLFCEKDTDIRCANDSYLLYLIGNLVYVGGKNN